MFIVNLVSLGQQMCARAKILPGRLRVKPEFPFPTDRLAPKRCASRLDGAWIEDARLSLLFPGQSAI
jgi:hypothetical protein